jgi:cytochrome P450
VTQAFTPRIIEQMAGKIEAIAHRLLDRVITEGQMDFVRDFASPLPIIVIAEMLGIPEEDRERFKQWSDALVGNDYERVMQCQEEMSHYFAGIAAERRARPQDDLISRLVQAQSDGVALSEVELIGFCILLLVAGNETTTNLLSSAVLCLDSLPEVQREVRTDRQLIPPTIEEVLRYCSPVQRMERRIKKDVDFRGYPFKAGQTVVTQIGSANHDERVFADPERFDIRRSPNPHLAFGHGIHFCLGAPLARLEAKIALNVLFDRLPHFRRSQDPPLERLDSWLVFGVKQLPIYWN